MPKKIRIIRKKSHAIRERKRIERKNQEIILEAGLFKKARRWFRSFSLEKGGSILNRGKRQKEASKFIKDMLEKEINIFLRDLVKDLKEKYPGFPNNDDHEQFLLGAQSILAVYYSIVAAAGQCGTEGLQCSPKNNLKKGDDGWLPISIANEIIQDLETFAKNIVDYRMGDKGAHFMKEGEEHQKIYSLTEQQVTRMDELWGSSKSKMDKAIAASEEGEALPGEEVSDRERLFGKGKKTFKMRGLESKFLPAVLAAMGSATGLAHIITASFVPSDYTFESFGDAQAQEAVEKEFGGLEQAIADKGENLTSTLAELAGSPQNATTMGEFAEQFEQVSNNTNYSIEEITAAFEKDLGMPMQDADKMMNHMVEFGKANADASYGSVVNDTGVSQEFINHVAQSDPQFAEELKEGAAGSGRFKGGFTNLLGIKPGAVVLAASWGWRLTKEAFRQSGHAVMDPTFTQALVGSGALAKIGIAFLAAGAAIGWVRKHGLEHGRAAAMQAIIDKINPISGAQPEPVEEDCVTLAKKIDSEIQVGDFVMYEERQGSKKAQGEFETDFSVAIVVDKLKGVDADIENPKNLWTAKEEEGEEEKEELSEGPLPSGAALGTDRIQGSKDTGEDYRNRIFWNIFELAVRTSKKHGKTPSGTQHAAAVLRKEGDNPCRPYITKISEEQARTHINTMLAGGVFDDSIDTFLNNDSEVAQNLRDQGAVQKIMNIIADANPAEITEQEEPEQVDPLGAFKDEKGGIKARKIFQQLGIGNPEADPSIQVYQFLMSVISAMNRAGEAPLKRIKRLSDAISKFSWRGGRRIPTSKKKEVFNLIASADPLLSAGEDGVGTDIDRAKGYLSAVEDLYSHSRCKEWCILAIIRGNRETKKKYLTDKIGGKKNPSRSTPDKWLEFVQKQDPEMRWQARPKAKAKAADKIAWKEKQQKRAAAYMQFLDSGDIVKESAEINETYERWKKLAGILKG